MTKEKTAQQKVGEITDEVLTRVIDLARLDPLETGMSLQKEHLVNILGHFKVLSQVRIDEINPTIQINPTPIPLRKDVASDWLNKDKALSNARMRTDEFFLAPKILGNEDPDHA